MADIGRSLMALVAVCAVLVVAACATTRIDAQWQNPEFAGATIKGPVMVVGLTREESIRRLYEDAMVARLAERGVQARPSYQVMSGPLEDTSSDRLLQAARAAGMQNVISSGLIRREVVERAMMDPPGWHWDPWYSGWYRTYWPYAYAPEVHVYERYIANTSVADVASGKVIWSARTSTEDAGDLKREVEGFAKAIVRAMAQQRLV